jgi:ketosteroid isomerase-like protein
VSAANLDLVRSIVAGWERGDFGSAEWADHDIEYVIADGPSPGCWKGLSGMTKAARDALNAWESYSVEADEWRVLDEQRVLVLFNRRGRGKTSGLELGHMCSKGANLFQVRDGKVNRLVFYWDRDRALADLGLAPEGDAA